MCYHRTMRRVDPGRAGPAAGGARRSTRRTRWPRPAGSTTPAATTRGRCGARGDAAVDGQADAARVVLGRVQLERFRQTARSRGPRGGARVAAQRRCPVPPTTASASNCRSVRRRCSTWTTASAPPQSCSKRRWTDRWCSGPVAHERVLDWWATALDRHAQSRPAGRAPGHLRPHPASACAPSWRSTAGRRRPATGWRPRRAAPATSSGPGRRRSPAGCGPSLAPDRGAALRADLDRLVTQAIIPERATACQHQRSRARRRRGMENEWAAFKDGRGAK